MEKTEQNSQNKKTTTEFKKQDVENSFDLLNKSIWNFEKRDEVDDFIQKFNYLKEKDMYQRKIKPHPGTAVDKTKVSLVTYFYLYFYYFGDF